MDTKSLNARKKEILNAQDTMLRNAMESKVQLTAADETAFTNMTAELDTINLTLSRSAAIDKGRSEVGQPTSAAVVAENRAASKFYAMGISKNTTPLPTVTNDYVKGFWGSLKSSADFQRFQIQNASLGEGGSSAAGGALVPIEVDPTIPPLAIEECTARQLSRVITTEMNLELPYQASLTVSALKAESNSGGTNAFATNAPTFGTTTLSAYLIGDSVYASWELLQDSKAASEFISMDLMRSIVTKEENLFVNGNGSGQPQGYLGNSKVATGATITAGAGTLNINNVIDTMGSLNKAYYKNAKWLVSRQEFNRLLKAQVAASQYQVFITFDTDGNARLFGYPIAFSTEMPVYVASPATQGAWMFGDFARYAVIGDRGDSNVRVKVLDQPAALNAQTVILGYRRADQRVLISEAVVQLNTSA